MTPGMTLGESASGALTLNDFEPENQWVELAFADDGDPWAIVVTNDRSLRVAGTTCQRHRLTVGTTIRLPNNTLFISRDIRLPRHSETVIEVVPRNILQRLVRPVRHVPPDPEWHRPPAAARRPLAVLLALGAVTAVGVVALLVSTGEADSARIASVEPIRIDAAPIEAPTARPEAPVGDAVPAQVPDAVAGAARPPDPESTRSVEVVDLQRLPTAEAVPSSPSAAADPEPEQVAMRPRAAPERERPTPIVLPPVARRSMPPLPPVEAPVEVPMEAPVEAPVEAPIDVPPGATAGTELAEIAWMAQAEELSRQRDLLAADLALAQGRLTSPPEDNAYSLYNRVLAADPHSPEATNGLRAVRQELINRFLAQLAGDDLDGSRRTLQAAADVGVDPQLVADLHDEIDFRQRLIDATQ